MDEIEVQIVGSCIALGVSYLVPLMRYQIERDTERAKRELAEWYRMASQPDAGNQEGGNA